MTDSHTIPQTAKKLGVHVATVYRRIHEGELPAYDTARPGAKRTKLRVRDIDLQAFQESRLVS